MEEELRQTVVQQVVLADELFFARRAGLDGDLARGGIGKRSLWQAFDKREHGVDAFIQVGKTGTLGVGEGRHLHPGQARRHALGKVAGNQHLARHGEHVGEQPGLQQGIRLDLARRGMGLGLGQHVFQGAQHLAKDGDAGVVDGVGHGVSWKWCEAAAGATCCPIAGPHCNTPHPGLQLKGQAGRDWASAMAAWIAARAWGLFFQQVEPTMAEAVETMSRALALPRCASDSKPICSSRATTVGPTPFTLSKARRSSRGNGMAGVCGSLRVVGLRDRRLQIDRGDI